MLMGVLGCASFITGMVFTSMGAWPVLGFFGLDVLIVYIAFRLNYRAGRLHETIEVSRSDLTVTRIHPTGRRERFNFNPYWVRVRLAEGRDGRTDLRLHLHGKELAFGRFLTDDERRDFAKVTDRRPAGGPRRRHGSRGYGGKNRVARTGLIS